MKTNGSVVLGIIALIMVSIACVVLIFYRFGGGRESNSKTIRYAGRLGKLLFAASVILIAIGLIAVPSKGEGFNPSLTGVSAIIHDETPLVEGSDIDSLEGALEPYLGYHVVQPPPRNNEQYTIRH